MSDPRLIESAQLQAAAFDGRWRELAQSQPAREPGSGRELGRVGLASPDDIAAAAARAAEAQRDWATLPYDDRAGILREAARLAEAHREELADWLVRESGSAQAKAAFEAKITIKAMHEAAAMPSQGAGQVLPAEPGRLNLARRRPVGVVGVISPFNFPLYLAMRAVAPALAVGNAVLLKPDPRTAICGGAVIARLYERAGLPSGVLAMLPGDGTAGSALCADPHVQMIQFTGSTAAGRKVGEAAGRHLKKVSLELGGKNALIVLDDADLDRAVKNAAWSAFLHQGQICMAAGRILVQAGIADAFARRLAAHAQGIRVGDPKNKGVALGPLIDAEQARRAAGLVAGAVKAGARIAAGGEAEGTYFPATVLTGVARDNPAYADELFAPVALITPFETDDEAVALANHGDYGLSAAILSRSVGRALALGERLHVGLLHINDATVNDEVINPFGGVGASGNGLSIGGPANWAAFTEWQWLTVRGEPPTYPL